MSPYAIPGIRINGATTFADIEDVVCTFYNRSPEEVYSKSRNHELVTCRHLIAFFCIEFMGLSTPAIGRHMKCNHTSVMYGRRMVQDRKHTEQLFGAEVEEMRKRIHERRFTT